MRGRVLFKAGVFGLMVAGLASLAFARKHADLPARVLKVADADNNGTIDLDEAKNVAAVRFLFRNTGRESSIMSLDLASSTCSRTSRLRERRSVSMFPR